MWEVKPRGFDVVMEGRVWLDTDGVRPAGEHSGHIWKRNNKTGPNNSKRYSNSKMAFIPLQKKKKVRGGGCWSGEEKHL